MSDPLFANGVINAAYSGLLDPGVFANFRNLDNKDFVRLLKNYGYGDASGVSFEQIIMAEELKHKRFLASLIDGDHLIFKILYLSFDQLFLASLFKAWQFRLAYKPTVRGLSTFDEESLADYMFSGHELKISPEDKELMDGLKTSTAGKTAQEISDLVSRALTDRIAERLEGADEYLLVYYQYLATVENILLMVRSGRFRKDLSYVDGNFIKGGLIEKHILLGYYDKPLSELASYLSMHFPAALLDAVKDEKNENYLKNLDDLFGLLAREYYKAFGFDLESMASAVNLTLKKREEIIRLKKLYYQTEEDMHA